MLKCETIEALTNFKLTHFILIQTRQLCSGHKGYMRELDFTARPWCVTMTTGQTLGH